jgi:hypothetical protein
MSNKFKMNNDKEWLEKIGKDDYTGCISAGGLYEQRLDEKKKLVGISEFVKRQTKESQFTNFDGTWEELEQLLNHWWRSDDIISFKQGYRDGVTIISVNPNRFYTYTDFPMFEGMKMSCEWAKIPGREHESAKLQTKILEPKNVCKFVDIILYRKDVLEEDGDSVTGAMCDVVSINGRLTEEPKPMDPMTIVRNWKHLPGGTEMKDITTEDVLEQLCQSIMYKNGIKNV